MVYKDLAKNYGSTLLKEQDSPPRYDIRTKRKLRGATKRPVATQNMGD